MDLTLIKLSIEQLLQKVEKLEAENKELKLSFSQIESKLTIQTPQGVIQLENDKLIDTKEVLQMLGISYNTFKSIVKKTLIVPVRINQRRVRYSYKSILEYIKSRSH